MNQASTIDLSDLFLDRRRTTPWADDEFLMVDNRPYVYTVVSRERITVHLPGCRSASVDELRAEGRDVRLPKRWRR